MRIAFAFLVFAICVATSSATFKLLRSKLQSAASVHQPARYRTLKYPVVIPETTYARPVSTYVSTYTLPSPAVATVPYAAPAYSTPVTVAYEAPVVQFEPGTLYLEPYSTYSTQVIELCSK